MSSIIRNLSAALTGFALLANIPAFADQFQDEKRAVAEIRAHFKKSAEENGIPISPMMSVKNINDFLAFGPSALEDAVEFHTYNLYRHGFNMVFITCPGENLSRFLPTGIMMTEIRDPDLLSQHMQWDTDTTPRFDTNKKRVNQVNREFSYVSIGHTLTRLTPDSLPALKDKLFKDGYAIDGVVSYPTPEMIKIMQDQYKETCRLEI